MSEQSPITQSSYQKRLRNLVETATVSNISPTVTYHLCPLCGDETGQLTAHLKRWHKDKLLAPSIAHRLYLQELEEMGQREDIQNV
jgi:hypothetical protein